jgi:hypothetical protein
MALGKIVAAFGALILVFDTAWSLAALSIAARRGVPVTKIYVRGIVGSLTIYAIAGGVAARFGSSGAIAGVCVAIIEAALGSVISTKLRTTPLSREQWLRVLPNLVMMQVALGVAFGMIGTLGELLARSVRV